VVDVSVLHGPGKVHQFLRVALGLPPKGIIDANVVEAAQSHGDPNAIIISIANQRRAHYDAIIARNPSQQKWKRGWYNRTARVEAECCDLASVTPTLQRNPLTDVGRPVDIEPPKAEAKSMVTSKEGNIQVVNGTVAMGTAAVDAQNVAVSVVQKAAAAGKPVALIDIVLGLVSSPLFIVGIGIVCTCAASWIFRARKRWELGI
jgi:lysozyme family protein